MKVLTVARATGEIERSVLRYWSQKSILAFLASRCRIRVNANHEIGIIRRLNPDKTLGMVPAPVFS